MLGSMGTAQEKPVSCSSIPEALQQMIHKAEAVLQHNLHSLSVSLLNTLKRNFNMASFGPKEEAQIGDLM